MVREWLAPGWLVFEWEGGDDLVSVRFSGLEVVVRAGESREHSRRLVIWGLLLAAGRCSLVAWSRGTMCTHPLMCHASPDFLALELAAGL